MYMFKLFKHAHLIADIEIHQIRKQPSWMPFNHLGHQAPPPDAPRKNLHQKRRVEFTDVSTQLPQGISWPCFFCPLWSLCCGCHLPLNQVVCTAPANGELPICRPSEVTCLKKKRMVTSCLNSMIQPCYSRYLQHSVHSGSVASISPSDLSGLEDVCLDCLQCMFTAPLVGLTGNQQQNLHKC